jgi:hypothetical protein
MGDHVKGPFTRLGYRRIAAIVLLATLVVWLALPATAAADDCSNGTWGELRSCPGYVWDKGAAFMGAALAAIGAALRRAMRDPGPTTETPPREVPWESLKPSGTRDVNKPDPVYDPGGSNLGGGPDGTQGGS